MDIKCQHIKSREIKVLPEKVFNQVQHKYKFIEYVNDVVETTQSDAPNASYLPEESKDARLVVGDDYGFGAVKNSELLEETHEQLKIRYANATGKKPGNKSKATLQKELNEL